MEYWQMAMLWLRHCEDTGRTARSLYESRGRMRNHVLPFCADWDLGAFRRRDANALYWRVAGAQGVGARGHRKGGAGVARRTVREVRAQLGWAVDQEMIEINPWSGWKSPTSDGQRGAVVRGAGEYRTLMIALDALEERYLSGDRAGGVRPVAADLFRVLICTGLRLGEALTLEWPLVDMKDGIVTLECTKSQALGRTSVEQVDMPDMARAALWRRWTATGGLGLVFPPDRGERLSCMREWLRVKRAAHLPKDLTRHGLRHSLATHAAAGGMDQFRLQSLLRHASLSTTARYVHASVVIGRPAAEAWALAMDSGNDEPDPVVRTGLHLVSVRKDDE